MLRRSLLIRLIVPAGLIVLVGVLAGLEYRWLGQVSEADRERRRSSLQAHAVEFSDDFDRELLLIYRALQVDGRMLQQGNTESLTRRLDSWREIAREPRLLRGIYFLPSAATQNQIEHYDAATRKLVTVDWPAELDPLKRSFSVAVTPDHPAPLNRVFSYSVDPFNATIPAIIATVTVLKTPSLLDPGPLVTVREPVGSLVACLDSDVLRNSFLPSLAERYFPSNGDDAYRLSIVDARDHDKPILTRGLSPGAVITHPDAQAALFRFRLDLAPQLVAGTMTSDFMMASQTVTLRETARTRGGDVAAGAVAPGRGSLPPAAPKVTRENNISAVFSSQPSPSRPVQPSGLQIFVQSTGTTPDMFGGSWVLSLQHTAGSLDAAVNQARQRNLWLSFSILGVLGIGVALIVVNAQQSERLAAQQMDFVATVSHELRTPLAVIRSAAQNLSAGVVIDSAQARKYGEVIDAEGRRLTDMVEQVLEYAGLSGGRRPTMARPIDMGAVAKDALSACESLLPAEQFEVELDIAADLPPVIADEGAIRRALTNLITNALKYGSDGRWLGLTVRRAQARHGDEVQVTVSDHGRGIEASDLPHIFEPFYRGRRAVDEQVHGNGLGLSLVKRIVDAHGGRVSVKSAPGEGTAFTLHLPADRQVRAGVMADASPASLEEHQATS